MNLIAILTFVAAVGLCAAIWNLWLRQKEEIIQRLGGDQMVAERLMQAGRLDWAEDRVALWQREQRHMCLATGCRKPVAGKMIFAHCEEHLDKWEQGWWKDRAEDQIGTGEWPKISKHPISKIFDEHFAELDKDAIQQRIEMKDTALTAAYALLKQSDVDGMERKAFLPLHLRRKLEHKTTPDSF